jgi:hypothetical protein
MAGSRIKEIFLEARQYYSGGMLPSLPFHEFRRKFAHQTPSYRENGNDTNRERTGGAEKMAAVTTEGKGQELLESEN